MSTHPHGADEDVGIGDEVPEEPDPSALESLIRQVARAPIAEERPLAGELLTTPGSLRYT